MDKWLQCLASGLKSLQMVTFGTWLVVWKTEHLSASDTVVLKKKKKKKLFGNHWSKESEYFFPNWDLDKPANDSQEDLWRCLPLRWDYI